MLPVQVSQSMLEDIYCHRHSARYIRFFQSSLYLSIIIIRRTLLASIRPCQIAASFKKAHRQPLMMCGHYSWRFININQASSRPTAKPPHNQPLSRDR